MLPVCCLRLLAAILGGATVAGIVCFVDDHALAADSDHQLIGPIRATVFAGEDLELAGATLLRGGPRNWRAVSLAAARAAEHGKILVPAEPSM